MDTNSPTAPEVTVNSTLAPVAPTQPQIKYLMDLIDELAQYVTGEEAEKMREGYRKMYRDRTLTRSSISEEIKGMYPLIKLAREVAEKRAEETGVKPKHTIGSDLAGQVPAGRYAITGREGQTIFVHVVKFDSGAFIVKQQVADDTHRVSKVVARQMLQKILDAGIEEASTRYGRELGICGVCGRTLTNEDSRQLGIGPVCRERLAG